MSPSLFSYSRYEANPFYSRSKLLTKLTIHCIQWRMPYLPHSHHPNPTQLGRGYTRRLFCYPRYELPPVHSPSYTMYRKCRNLALFSPQIAHFRYCCNHFTEAPARPGPLLPPHSATWLSLLFHSRNRRSGRFFIMPKPFDSL